MLTEGVGDATIDHESWTHHTQLEAVSPDLVGEVYILRLAHLVNWCLAELYPPSTR